MGAGNVAIDISGEKALAATPIMEGLGLRVEEQPLSEIDKHAGIIRTLRVLSKEGDVVWVCLQSHKSSVPDQIAMVLLYGNEMSIRQMTKSRLIEEICSAFQDKQ